MRPAIAFLTCALLAAAVGADPPPTPTPAPDVARRPLTLDLDRVVGFGPDRGHAEFDSTLRREMWADPMVRLGVAVGREEAAARAGRGITFPPSYSAGYLLVTMPGPDPRLVLKGPWAADWHDLSTQEKIGRLAEGAAYAGLIIGILHGLR